MKSILKNINIKYWLLEIVSVVGTLLTIVLGLIAVAKHFTILLPLLLACVVGVVLFAQREKDYFDNLLIEREEEREE